MTEFQPNNPEGHPSQSPEDLAALEQARKQIELQVEAGEVLDDREKAPQVPRSSFQAFPSEHLAEKAAPIIGQPKVETSVHEEIPGMKMPENIVTDEEKIKALDELINNKDTVKPGGAHDVQERMEKLFGK